MEEATDLARAHPPADEERSELGVALARGIEAHLGDQLLEHPRRPCTGIGSKWP